MNKLTNVVIILLLIVAGTIYIFKSNSDEQLTPAETSGTAEIPAPTQSSEASPAAADTIVNYANSGFSPNTLNVKVGTAVTFVNNSTQQMWVASAYHPTHQVLPSLNQLKWVGTGGTYQYTFDKAGEWPYHNHLNPKDFGKVIVK